VSHGSFLSSLIGASKLSPFDLACRFADLRYEEAAFHNTQLKSFRFALERKVRGRAKMFYLTETQESKARVHVRLPDIIPHPNLCRS
jgi:hypothetical protein